MRKRSPEYQEQHRLREKARRAADPEKYRLEAEKRRRAAGMLPQKPAMSREEKLAKGRERERIKRRAQGCKEMIKFPVEERRARRNAWLKTWRKKNAERVKATVRRYKERNAEKIRARAMSEGSKAARMRYYLRNRHKFVKYWSQRCERWKNSIHAFHDFKVEEDLARIRNELSDLGVRHSIDHIIPLSHGGYHHHMNLQVMPFSLNCSKMDNPYWEQEGYKSWRDVPSFLWPESLRAEYSRRLMEDVEISIAV